MAVYRIEFLTAPPPSRVYVGPKKVYHSVKGVGFDYGLPTI
jgi:hypothetical protein